MKAVFIVGTGRSGTHFTTRLMNGFEYTRDPLDGKENPKILADVARAAIHHQKPSSSSENYYRKNLLGNGSVLLDQHHPNLFFVKQWSQMFDGIVFLYPQRPTYQVVASMLRHKGVMGWYKYACDWKRRIYYSRGRSWPNLKPLPYPNRFLGIAKPSDISNLPTHLLCAHRVIAHRNAYNDVVDDLQGALRKIDYEALVADPESEFCRVFSPAEMVALGEFTLLEKPKAESLSKFRDVLSDTQVAEIAELESQMLSPG